MKNKNYSLWKKGLRLWTKNVKDNQLQGRFDKDGTESGNILSEHFHVTQTAKVLRLSAMQRLEK